MLERVLNMQGLLLNLNHTVEMENYLNMCLCVDYDIRLINTVLLMGEKTGTPTMDHMGYQNIIKLF